MGYDIIPVICKGCGGGENGEKTSCLSNIRSVAENGDIAFMMYSSHVDEKVRALKYRIVYQYLAINNPTIPTGMYIMSEKTYLLAQILKSESL